MTENQKERIQDYCELIAQFVSGKLTASDFEAAYLARFKVEQVILPEPVFGILNQLFGEVDAFHLEPKLRGSGGLGVEELQLNAKHALAALARFNDPSGTSRASNR